MGKPAADEAGQLLTRADVTHLVVVARGSSDNAARYVQYLFGRAIGLSAYLATPSLYRRAALGPRVWTAPPCWGSRSPGSPPTSSVSLRRHDCQGRPTIAITNDAASPLALVADVVIPLLAGTERSVAATKTYTATLQALIQLTIGSRRNRRCVTGWSNSPDLLSPCARLRIRSRQPPGAATRVTPRKRR